MAQYFVVSLFGVVAVILGLVQTSFFGKYTRQAAFFAIALGFLAVISMFFFIDKEDWRSYLVASVEEKDKGKPSEGSLQAPKKDRGEGRPQGQTGSEGSGNGGRGMPGTSLGVAVHGESEDTNGGSDREAMRKILSDAGYDTSGMGADGSSASGSDDGPNGGSNQSGSSGSSGRGTETFAHGGMSIDMDELRDAAFHNIYFNGDDGRYQPSQPKFGMGAPLDNQPTNATSAHSGSVPTSAKEMAEASGETTDPEDDALKLLWDCKYCPRMVIVPVGVYVMGSPDDEPGHEYSEGPDMDVAIAKPFAIGMFEISKVEFQKFLISSGHKKQGRCKKVKTSLISFFDKKEVLSPDQYAMPALCMSWWDANAYVDWLTEKTGLKYRLPSAAEWEYAARALTHTAYHTGEDIDGTQAQFYHSQRAKSAPAKVYSFKPNQFGLYNMHGNAAEWVADCWHTNLYDAPSHQEAWTWRGDCKYRVTKGGSWLDGTYDLRAAARGRLNSVLGDRRIGLRVVRELY